MKKYPVEYTKEEIIEEINNSFEKVSNEVLSKGEKEMLIIRIQIGELHLENLLTQENNFRLKDIIENNRKTSRINYFLSILTVLIALSTLYHAIFGREVTYTDELNNIEKMERELEAKLETVIELEKKHLDRIDTTNVLLSAIEKNQKSD